MSTIKKRVLSCITVALALALLLPLSALADTDGNEKTTTSQPDRLVLQLGGEWAGVGFELRTDAGVFPVPVIVDDTGVLRMDLGGSKTYTLSCLSSSVSVPIPQQETEPPDIEPDETIVSPHESDLAPEAEENAGIPLVQLIVFITGLAVAIGGLLLLYIFKKRRESYDFEDDYDDWED